MICNRITMLVVGGGGTILEYSLWAGFKWLGIEICGLVFDTLYVNISREEGPDRFKLTENGQFECLFLFWDLGPTRQLPRA